MARMACRLFASVLLLLLACMPGAHGLGVHRRISNTVTTGGCPTGMVLTAAHGHNGTISSGESSLYQNNAQCSWIIHAGIDGQVRASISLEFEMFDLESEGQHTGKCYGETQQQRAWHGCGSGAVFGLCTSDAGAMMMPRWCVCVIGTASLS